MSPQTTEGSHETSTRMGNMSGWCVVSKGPLSTVLIPNSTPFLFKWFLGSISYIKEFGVFTNCLPGIPIGEHCKVVGSMLRKILIGSDIM